MKLKYCGVFLFLFFLTSCQTYTRENEKVREHMYASNFDEALKLIDQSALAQQERNYSLFRMEKGMLLYLQKDYEKASTLWREADRHLDDLYTTSISKTATSFIVNDAATDYEGEAHERILLPLFSSLAFYAEGNVDNAVAMVRRTYNVASQLKKESSILKYDVFTHYFSAYVYEGKHEWDNAIVEYRAALNALNDQEKSSAVTEAKAEVLKALERLAKFRRRQDVLDIVQRANVHFTPLEHMQTMRQGEVLVVYESGKSPIKVAEDVVVPTGKTVVRVSFPKYTTLPYSARSVKVLVGNKFYGNSIVMENIGAMAQQALADRRGRDLVKMAARIVAKEAVTRKTQEQNEWAGLAVNLLNVATEVADTRSWTALPDSIQVVRVVVPANHATQIEVVPQGGGEAQTFTVTLEEGEKQLIRFRTFR